MKEAFLILDSAPCHKTAEVRDAAKKAKIKLIFVPPRLTNLLSPPDVCWFGPIKNSYRRLWSHWFITDPKTFTYSGNMRSAGYQKVIGWLSNIWKEFDPALIRKSFHSCGIVSVNDLHLPLATLVAEHILVANYVDDDSDTETDVSFID